MNDISWEKYQKIELGCGKRKNDGWLGVDIRKTPLVDIVMDLDQMNWELPSNHFKIVRALDIFEHLNNPINFMEEIWRICKNGAIVIIRGPHKSSLNWDDPTHKRLMGRYVFEHFITQSEKSITTKAKFKIIRINYTFDNFNKIFGNFFVKRWPFLYEHGFPSRIFPAENIEFVLKVEKEK
jgi:predicted SAM-dependent methyltransferase